jgi:NAD(P)-dependent dehydrogenase (short-subunit alcohol dehydrogenase family)
VGDRYAAEGRRRELQHLTYGLAVVVQSPNHLVGRVAIVTGAGGGIGRAMALALADDGAAVVIADVEPSSASATAEVVDAAGGRSVVSMRDVADPEAAAGLIDDALQAFGRIDAIVHNAGILDDADLGDMRVEQWRRLLAVNLDGPFLLTRAAWPHLCAQRYGRMVFVTSASGLFGNVGQANYSAAKAGLIGLMKTVALEGAPHGVLANGVAPLALTPMARTSVPGSSSRVSARSILGPRFDEFSPEQVAQLVVALCREDCPSSGAVIASAGGLTREVTTAVAAGIDLASGDASTIRSHWDEVGLGPFDTPRSLHEDMALLGRRMDGLRGPTATTSHRVAS